MHGNDFTIIHDWLCNIIVWILYRGTAMKKWLFVFSLFVIFSVNGMDIGSKGEEDRPTRLKKAGQTTSFRNLDMEPTDDMTPDEKETLLARAEILERIKKAKKVQDKINKNKEEDKKKKNNPGRKG